MCKLVVLLGVTSLGLGSVGETGRGEEQGSARPDDQVSARQSPQRRNAFRMSTAVVCKSIDGYESYKKLPQAELTSDEKLLIYYRPLGFKSAFVDGSYQVHFTQDGQIRKRGEKKIVREKLKLLDTSAKSDFPQETIFLRNTVSLKGLAPGDYDFTIILHDEIAKGPTISQVVRFRIVPAKATEDESSSDEPKGKASSKKEAAPKDAGDE
jgi:hypothetical protein